MTDQGELRKNPILSDMGIDKNVGSVHDERGELEGVQAARQPHLHRKGGDHCSSGDEWRFL